jgi:archaellum component FlaC
MDRLDIIITKINKLEDDINNLKMEMKQIKGQTTKMDKHVDFINDIYNKIKVPINLIISKVNNYIGNRELE